MPPLLLLLVFQQACPIGYPQAEQEYYANSGRPLGSTLLRRFGERRAPLHLQILHNIHLPCHLFSFSLSSSRLVRLDTHKQNRSIMQIVGDLWDPLC
uniref:Secreted protein n=1 Tax=Arcella intermedia TaxID=1963864 RepID=A0A6B2LU06_9EUKA